MNDEEVKLMKCLHPVLFLSITCGSRNCLMLALDGKTVNGNRYYKLQTYAQNGLDCLENVPILGDV